MIQRWCVSTRCDPAARAIADRHYNRQSIGADNFVPPGRCAVFLLDDGKAFWVTSWPFPEYVKHDWPGAWMCSAFRSETNARASTLISLAVAATIAKFGPPPPLGMVTFIDTTKVRPTITRSKPTWGYSYRQAGFIPCGTTKGGLLALQLPPEAMPSPLPALPRTLHGLGLFDAAEPPIQPPYSAGKTIPHTTKTRSQPAIHSTHTPDNCGKFGHNEPTRQEIPSNTIKTSQLNRQTRFNLIP